LKPYKQLAGQTLIYGLGTIIPRVFNFLLTPLYTYNLPEAQFGVITEMYSYVAFFMVLLTFGMETTFFRFSAKNSNLTIIFNTAYAFLTTTGIFFIFFIILFKQRIANLLGYTSYSNLILLLAFIILFDVLAAIPLAKLRHDNKAKIFAIIRSSNVLINLSLNIFFFVICKDSHNTSLNGLYNENIGVGYAFISNLIASMFNFLVLLPIILKFRFRFNKAILIDMLKYAAPLVIVGFAGMINEVADKIFLKYLTPDYLNPLKQVGIYGANYKLAILMTIFIQMFKYAAEPFFFKQATFSDAKIIYSNVMTWFIVFCLSIFLLVTLYIDIFKYFIGSDYRVGLYIVPIVLLANMFLGIYYNLSIWYKLNNLTVYGALISIFGVLITISINFFTIPKIGYLGSAIATLICYLAMVVLSYLLGRRYYKVDYNIKRILSYITLALSLYGIKVLIPITDNIISFFISTLLMLIFVGIVIKVESVNFESFNIFSKSA